MKQCINCHQNINDMATVCPYCNCVQPPMPNPNYEQNNQYGGYQQSGYNNLYDYEMRNNAFDSCPEGKSRGITALLAIFLGGLGIQYFYLGKTMGGIITIILSLVTCGLWEVITLIQGIILLFMDNATFRQKFVLSNSTFPLF